MANIKCVVADIMQGAVNILHGGAIILYGVASILSNVPDILHVQHQFFEIIGVFRGNNTLFFKSSQKLV